jgi:hypothetical protein
MVRTDDNALLAHVAAVTGARRARRGPTIQSLWSGYGEILRVHLDGAPVESAVVKWVRPPTAASHPRGWSTNRSHQRKLASYRVERAFYAAFASQTSDSCRVPTCMSTFDIDGGSAFVLEDLDAAGFAERRADLSDEALDAVLHWLASFHATFVGTDADGLWDEGAYWHLATRPDELAATTDNRLKAAAHALDARLTSARYRTLVHGDAKAANFCFSADDRHVAAVDFQYVGGGCGMKDVAYFFSSCLSERRLDREADALLDAYFDHLRTSLARGSREVDAEAIESEWRALYPAAWADFARFLSGWAPGHWKLHGYAARMTAVALADLEVRS